MSLYLPNGNPIGTEKFAYKLSWMARMRQRAEQLLEDETPLVLAGDFNVIPEPVDAKRGGVARAPAAVGVGDGLEADIAEARLPFADDDRGPVDQDPVDEVRRQESRV